MLNRENEKRKMHDRSKGVKRLKYRDNINIAQKFRHYKFFVTNKITNIFVFHSITGRQLYISFK